MAKSKAFTVVKQPMQSKELHIKPIHFLFTNDTPALLPFQRMQCVTNMYIRDGQSPLRHKQEMAMINEFDCALKSKAYTKIVQASMKSIIIKVVAIQLEENYFHQFQVRFLPGLGLYVL